ncbi:MAG: thiamine pyrophosphate-dependent dehydrogenase E1 component subunit alpha [Candidatus Omnitrophica bacterium]|nr:thiamine pyrophosphate-dependent dehydrogenase E1 component subunit alpha [Candidatus Omnitrophota bacterium]
MHQEEAKLNLYSKMFLIRSFEKRLFDLFKKGKLFGTTHGCIGQEAVAVSVVSTLPKDTIYFSNHRCHGHFLAYSDRPDLLLAELMGKKGGVCAGRGGSQHLCYKDFFTNGVQGGIVPVATGIALAEKLKKSGRTVCVFIGDGTLGQGVVYESMNMASLWSLPILFVLENNQYAMSTFVRNAVAGSITARAEAFGIRSWDIVTSDVFAMCQTVQKACDYIAEEPRPGFLAFETYRFCGHSKSDECHYRTAAEVQTWAEKDAFEILQTSIKDKGKRELIEQQCLNRLEEVVREVEAMPFADV